MVNAIGGLNNAQFDNLGGANNIARDAVNLSVELNGVAKTLQSVGGLVQSLGKIVGSAPQANVANANPLNTKLGNLVQQLTNLLGGINQMLTGLAGAAGGAQGAAGGAAPAGEANGVRDIQKALGLDQPQDLDGDKRAKAKTAAKGGGQIKSLSELLAIIGSMLTKTMENTMNQMADIAKQIDAAGTKGPTAELNQKLQQATFALQQIQQSLNRVVETVTSLSKSEADAKKEVTRNLAV
jgi:hypothetical protein